MEMEWPKLIAEMVLIFVTVGAVEMTGMIRGASRTKRALVTGLAIFLVLVIFRVLWP